MAARPSIGDDGKGDRVVRGMAGNNLAQMTDMALLKLFEVIGVASTTRRAKQVRVELERRGYIFDPMEGDFTTCAEWNQRHPSAPKNCVEEARQRENQEREQRRRDGGWV